MGREAGRDFGHLASMTGMVYVSGSVPEVGKVLGAGGG